MNNNYLAIDIGGTNVKYGIINHSGELVFHKSAKTPQNKTEFLSLMSSIVKNNMTDIKGIGISVPGKINVDTGMIYYGGALPFLDKVNLKQELERNFNISVAVENDGKAGALAELWLGTLKDVDNGAIIILGTGIGGGIVLNHQLIHGSHYQAGELSYMNLKAGTKDQSYLVGYLGSSVHMIEKCASVLNLDDKHDGIAVFNAINQNDPRVTKIFSNYCDVIASIILNVQSVIDLKTFAISGGISAQPIVIKEINQAYTRLLESNPLLKAQLTFPNIVQARFKNNANLYGAIYNFLLQNDLA